MQRRALRNTVIGYGAAMILGMGHYTGAAAQNAESFEVGAQIATSRFGELDTTDIGFGGRASWHPSGWIGVEGELNFYPRDIPTDDRAISRSRFEGLFGLTAGPRLNRWRPFARVRPGFLQVSSARQPVACIRIFPPPLRCELAQGHTLFTLDVGAGLEVFTPGRSFVRFDIGDQIRRFPGPALDRDFHVHDDDFIRHDLRVALGAGWRF